MHFLNIIYSLSIPAKVCIAFGTVLVLALLSFMIAQRIVSAKWFMPIQAPMMQVNSVIFALLIAFLITSIWKEVSNARAAVNAETHALAKIILYSSMLPDHEGKEVGNLVTEYIRNVTEREWKEMILGRQDMNARQNIRELMIFVEKWNPVTENHRLLQTSLISAVNEAFTARYDRIYNSRDIISPITWIMFLFLAFFVFLTIGVVHREHDTGRIVALFLYAALTGGMFLLILVHDQPFAHDILINAESYSILLK